MKTHHCQDYSNGSRDETISELSCFGHSPEIMHASFSSGEVGVHGTAMAAGVHGTAMAAATSACRITGHLTVQASAGQTKHGQKTTVIHEALSGPFGGAAKNTEKSSEYIIE